MCFGGCLDLSIVKFRNICWFFWDSLLARMKWRLTKIVRFELPWNYSSSFIAARGRFVLQTKYRANIIRQFIFVFCLYFFYHSSCPKDQFTVFISKFGTQDFSDPSLLNWFGWPSLVCRCAVLPSQVFKMLLQSLIINVNINLHFWRLTVKNLPIYFNDGWPYSDPFTWVTIRILALQYCGWADDSSESTQYSEKSRPGPMHWIKG